MKNELKPLLFKKRYTILLVFVISLLLSTAGYIYYNYSAKQIQIQNENELTWIAVLKINQIVQWNKERTADAKVISSDPLFISGIEEWLINKNNKSLTADIRTKLSAFQKGYGYEEIILASTDADNLLSSGSDLPIIDKETSNKIVESVKNRKIGNTDFHYCKIHNKIHYDIIAPLVNNKNKIIAAILLIVDPSDFLYPLIQSWPTPSKTAETLLIRKNNDKVLFLTELKYQKDAALKLEFPLTRKDIPAVQAVLGFKGLMKGNDYRGNKVLSYISNVPGTNWYMISKIDEDEIYSELKFREAIIILFLIVLIASLIIGTSWVYHLRQRNIYRQLYNTQEEFRTTLYSIGDAVITTDTNSSVQYINSAAEKLTGWNETEAKGEQLEKIFRIINEETRNKVENPIRKVLAEGVSYSLAKHTLLISKNGMEIPISDTGSPIRDETGEIVGVVLVFRDQSEERLNNKIMSARLMLYEYSQTHTLNELLTKTLDEVGDFTKSPIGFFHFMLPDQETLHLQAWSTETEKVFCKAEGKGLHYKVNEAGVWADAVRERKPVIHNDYASLINKKGMPEGHAELVREVVVPVLRNNKIVAVLGIGNKSSDYTEKDVEVINFISDVVWEIADNKKKEELVIQSEKFLTETQKIAQLGSYILDIQKGSWTSSEILDGIFGIDNMYPHTIDGWTSIIHPEWRELISDYFMNDVIGRHEKFQKSYKIIRKNDGEERWVNGLGRLEFDTNNRPVKMIGTIFDITERKDVEEKLQQEKDFSENLLETANTIILTLDKKANIITFNKFSERLTGYKREEVLGKNWFDLFIPKDNDFVISKVFSNVLIGLPQYSSYENPILCKNGSQRLISWESTVLKNVNGDSSGILSIGIDMTERKKAEDELQFHSEIMKNMNEALFLIRMEDGIIVHTNSMFEKLFGYLPGEMLGKNVSIVNAPAKKNPEETAKEIIDVLREKGVWEGEVNNIKKDGTLFWCYAKVSVFGHSKFGNVLIAIHTDVTERKLAEEALKKSESEFRLMAEAMPQIVWITRADGWNTYFNQQWVDYTGLTMEESHGHGWNKPFHPDDQQQAWDAWQNAIKNNSNYSIESRLRRADGVYQWWLVRGAPVIHADGSILKWFGTCTNINDVKLAQEAIRIHSGRLQNLHQIDTAILQAIESPESIVDTALMYMSNLLLCQRASVGIFDFEKKEVQVYATDINDKSIVQVDSILTEEVYGVIDILRESRLEIVEDMSKVPMPSAINKVLQAEGIQSSINVALISELEMYGVLNVGWEHPRSITTEEIEIANEVAIQITIAIEKARLLKETRSYATELEQRVIERTAQLENANKELEAFSYSVSHDLRAPLRGIDGFSNILLEDYSDKLDPEGQRLLNVIRTNTQMMGHLIDDLLIFSRVGRHELVKSDIDMKSMANLIYFEITSEEERKRISFAISNLPIAMGDTAMIRQLWTNLLLNAIKFSSKKEKPVIEISSIMDNEKTVYCIKDNGAGFDMRYYDKLFGVFQRLHTEQEFKGTGVGLAIAKRIVTKHGGDISAVSELNIGTTFYFYL